MSWFGVNGSNILSGKGRTILNVVVGGRNASYTG
jgi:hypothetical protein